MVARAPARPVTRGRPGASRRRAAGSRRHPRHLRGARPCSAVLQAEPRALRRSRRRDRGCAHPLSHRCEHVHERRGSRRLAVARRKPSRRPGSSGTGSASVRLWGFSRAGPTQTATLPSPSICRSRAPPSPTRSAGHGGRPASSTMPPSSSASVDTSMPPKLMRSVPWGSLWTSATGCTPSSPAPSWRSSPQSAGTPSAQGGSGGQSRARRAQDASASGNRSGRRSKPSSCGLTAPPSPAPAPRAACSPSPRPPASSPLRPSRRGA